MRLLKFCLFGLVLILNQKQVKAQDREKDSLLQIIQASKVDSVLVNSYSSLSRLFFDSNPNEGIKYARLGLELAQKTNFKLQEGRLNQTIGICYDYKDNLDSCLYYLNIAVDIFKKIGKIDAESHALADVAFAYYLRGNYELAIRNHLASLSLREKFGEPRFIAISQNSIGLIYRAKKDYAKAIYYYKESLKNNVSISKKTGIIDNYINLSAAYQNNKSYDSAYYYAKLGFDLADSINQKVDKISCELNIANALWSLKKNDEAYNIIQKIANNKELFKDKRNEVAFYQTYASILQSKQTFNKANDYAKKGIEVAKKLGWKEAIMKFYETLAKNYVELGNSKAAYSYSDSAKSIAEKIYTEENSRQVNEMNTVYETVEKTKQIDKLTTENLIKDNETKIRKKERNYFIFSSLIFLILAAIALKAFITNKKQKEKLRIQNNIIEKSLKEKELLLREIHHRVKNNLQIVSSLLSLQSNYIQDEKALSAVLEGKNRVESMGLIHQFLYQDESLAMVDMQNYIATLCDNLWQSYNIQPNTILLQKNIQKINIDVDTVIPLGLMINELITNCLKYAFTNTQIQGIIKLTLQQENRAIKLIVKDNGKGLPENFDAKSKKTFGYKMIQAFLQKLKASINVYNDNGTCVEIEIANYKGS